MWDAIPTSFAGQQYDSPQTVLCTVPQLFARRKFSNAFDATRSMRVAQNTRVDQKGADENFWIADLFSGYKLNVEKPKQQFPVCCTAMSI
jgi:uncharacterized protein YegJ (DUF2314 family)